jgi:hypothetical protein
LLYCCGCYFQGETKLNLYDNTTHKERILEFGRCPKCGALKAYIKQVRIKDGKFCEKKPKNTKDVKKFIDKYKQEPYYVLPKLNVKYGTKQNMGWIYGENKEIHKGNNVIAIRQYQRDGNNTRRAGEEIKVNYANGQYFNNERKAIRV